MLQVTKLYVRSLDLDHKDVFWEIKDFSEGNIRDYDFYLLRSESPAGPFDPLVGPFQDQYYFRDTTALSLHKFRKLYYLLRIVNRLSSESQDFGPSTQDGEQDLIAMEINRQEDLLFREFTGRRCWVFPVRTFGQTCVCFDKVSGRRERSMCLTCFGTGYLGGFLAPIETFIQFDPNANESTLTPMHEQQNQVTSARLISFPPIKPKDVVVETENARWRVTRATTTERLRAVVHQELTLRQIERGDVEYKLPINIADLRALSPAAERNYTVPMHTDGIDEDSILAVYGNQPRGSAR